MSRQSISPEWQQYLIDKDKEYTIEEMIEKVREAIRFLKSKHIRITDEFFTDMKKFSEKYILTDIQKNELTREYEQMGYACNDSVRIVDTLQVLYKTFDLTLEETTALTTYIVENHLTVSEVTKERFGFSLEDWGVFCDEILIDMATYFMEQVRDSVDLSEFAVEENS